MHRDPHGVTIDTIVITANRIQTHDNVNANTNTNEGHTDADNTSSSNRHPADKVHGYHERLRVSNSHRTKKNRGPLSSWLKPGSGFKAGIRRRPTEIYHSPKSPDQTNAHKMATVTNILATQHEGSYKTS